MRCSAWATHRTNANGRATLSPMREDGPLWLCASAMQRLDAADLATAAAGAAIAADDYVATLLRVLLPSVSSSEAPDTPLSASDYAHVTPPGRSRPYTRHTSDVNACRRREVADPAAAPE